MVSIYSGGKSEYFRGNIKNEEIQPIQLKKIRIRVELVNGQVFKKKQYR